MKWDGILIFCIIDLQKYYSMKKCEKRGRYADKYRQLGISEQGGDSIEEYVLF